MIATANWCGPQRVFGHEGFSWTVRIIGITLDLGCSRD